MTHHPPEQSEENESETLPVICPSCLTPNPAHQHFCRKCGTPLTTHAEIDPMGQIYAQGDAFRKAIANPRSNFIVLGMWLIVGPNAVFFTTATVRAIMWPFTDPLKGIQDILIFLGTFIGCGCGALLFDLMLYRLMRNFIRRRKQRVELTPSDSEQDE